MEVSPYGSGGKESACTTEDLGDMGQIPVMGRSTGGRKWQPTAVFLPEKLHGQRSWWATVHGVAKSQTQLNN